MASYKSGQVSAQLFSNGPDTQKNKLASLFAPKPKAQPKDKNIRQGGGVNETLLTTSPKLKKKKKQVKDADKTKTSSQNGGKENLGRVTTASVEKKTKEEKINKSASPQMSSKDKRDSDKKNNVTKEAKDKTAWTAPFVHEALVAKSKTPDQPKQPQKAGKKRKLEKGKKDDSEDFIGKRPRRDRVRDKQNDSRTIFIGNCPLSADKKVLKSLFKEYGEIESMRFRCAPPADPNLPRRAIVITKNFHERGNSYVAYIVFKEEEAAKKALVKNGYLLDGLHLRVDISAMSRKHDKKRSVFVGNLPFDITEEGLWSHFEDCGDITNVRIVRDRQTSIGKGIGYVQFESKDSVTLALKLNKTKVEGREIRVMVCTKKDKDKSDKKKTGDKPSVKRDRNDSSSGRLKHKKPMFGPSNSTTATFKAKLQQRKEKLIRKLKKKKESAKKSDGDTTAGLVSKPKPKVKPAKFKNAKKKGLKAGKKPSGKKGKKAFNKGQGKTKSGKVFKKKDKNFKRKS